MVVATVTSFLTSSLPRPWPTVLVGLSGGADSVALLAALTQAGVKCVAAHCNFHLRGPESDRDTAHCANVCRQLGVEMLTAHFDVEARRRERGESVEMACRALRYDWWHSLLDKGTASWIAVGHHLEDNVETLMLNLMRGCGMAGAKGMLPVAGRILRPLLTLTRPQLESYLRSRSLGWVDDHTNALNDFSRNKLRNIVLPVLEEQFPGATAAMARSMETLAANHALYTGLVGRASRGYMLPGGGIDLASLYSCEPQATLLLHEVLPPLGLNHSQTTDIAALFESQRQAPGHPSPSGQLFDTPAGTWVLDRGKLIPMPHSDGGDGCSYKGSAFPPSIALQELSPADFAHELSLGKPSPTVLYLDAAALEGTPVWELRPWRRGDRMRPYGMRGSRLLSDIFNDLKLPAPQRAAVKVLVRDGVILWVAGIRASAHFAVGKDTLKVLKATCPEP